MLCRDFAARTEMMRPADIGRRRFGIYFKFHSLGDCYPLLVVEFFTTCTDTIEIRYDLHRHHRPMDLVGFILVLGHSTRPDSSIRSVATRRILASNSDAI